MNKRYSSKYDRKIYEIFAGEYFTTDERKVILQTLLGSCIAVCFKDKYNHIVGINHFMLPGNPRAEKVIYDKNSRYGINSMELVINSMMKKGARRENLEAKVFGGGKVMKWGLNNVAENNIEFVLAYLKMERIPISARDVGGDYGRKVIMFSDSFAVYRKKIKSSKVVNSTLEKEKKLLSKVKKKNQKKSDITLFEQEVNNGQTN